MSKWMFFNVSFRQTHEKHTCASPPSSFPRWALSWLGDRLQAAFDAHGKVPQQDTLDRLDWPDLTTAPESNDGG